jgi:2-methylcitrate dehydratase PrpD
MTSSTPGLSRHIEAQASFAAAWHRSPVPQGVAAFGRLLLLDTLGALVGATRYPEVRAMRERLGSPSLRGAALPFAALFRLGTAATWLDADSGGSFHPEGDRMPPVPTAHPAPHVLPVLLQGAAEGVGDDELLQIFVVATEIGMRFGTATSLRPGMHPHGIHGPVAAAVAGSLLRGHPANLIAVAMTQALATPMAARLWEAMEGGTVRNAWTGLGTYYGAKAAAEAGHGEPVTMGSAEAALRSVVSPEIDLALLSDGLGARWLFLDSYLKPYACARWIHPALDALSAALPDRVVTAALCAPHGLRDFEQVERVDVETFAFAASLAGTDLRSDLHARFSLPACIATLLVDGELHAAGFLPARLERPEVARLAQRVHVRENADFTAALPLERPTTVTITWTDGRATSRHVRNGRGNPDDPLSPADIVAKFRSNVSTVLSDELARQCSEALAFGHPVGGSLLAAVGDALQ